MKRLAASLGVLAGTFVAVVAAQEVPRLALAVRDEVPVPSEPAEGLLNPVRCDSRGNVYLRPWRDVKPMSAPVVKISLEGRREAQFSVDSVPDLGDDWAFEDFALGPRGDLFALIQSWEEKESQALIARFDDDGKFDSSLVLKQKFDPALLTITSTGQFFVTGSIPLSAEETRSYYESRQEEERRGPPPARPYAGIFDRGGRLVVEVSFEKDKELGSEEDKDFPGALPGPLITLGRVVSGSDGNVYLLRRSRPAVVYVVSPLGELVRVLEVQPPAENFQVTHMMLGQGGRLLFQFAEEVEKGRYRTGASTFSLVNPETGERLTDYVSTPEVGGSLACASTRELLFLGVTESERLAIRRVVPR